MARLANVANLGYVPIPRPVSLLIASYIEVPHASSRVADICAGEGIALLDMSQVWRVTRDQCYANEIHPQRYLKAKQSAAMQATNADTLVDLQAPRNAFQVLYANPPFMWEGREAGGSLTEADFGTANRLENLFWDRAIKDGSWLQPGGIAIYVAPDHVFRRARTVNHLCRYFERVTWYRPPEDHRHFNEWVVFGVRRSTDLVGDAHANKVKAMRERFADEPAELTRQDTPLYQAPPATPLPRMWWRSANDSNPTQAQKDIITTGGAWSGRKYAEKQQLVQRQQLPALMPLNLRQALLRVADGAINGSEVSIYGEDVRIKGSTMLAEKRWTVDKSTDAAEITEQHSLITRTPVIVTQNLDGLLRRYQGDEGIRKLCEREDTMEALVAKVREAVPARYQMEPPEEVARVLANITPRSRRVLPGQQYSGLLPMQQHVAAAWYQAVTTKDTAWGKQPRAAIIAAEMGCGKTSMGIACALLVHKLRLTRNKRAARVIVSAPNHLIGDKAQVEAHWKSGAPLPPWYEEWLDFAPGWHMVVCESPYDLSEFFRHADRNPDVPHVAFVTNSKLSLDSGFAPGCENRWNSPLEESKSGCIWWQEDAEKLKDLLEKDRARAKKQRAVVQTYGSNSTSDTSGTAAREETWRDRVRALPTVRYGLCCPDCGQRWLTKKLEPGTIKDLSLAPGISKQRCEWCGGTLGQMVRERDNVQDRGLQVYRAERERVPVLPWGTRPQSNPRMAIGRLIGRRFKHCIDLYIADEVHESKGNATAIGNAFGAVASASERTLALTGTLYGGKARDVYSLLLRLGNVPVMQRYGWKGVGRFIDECGVVDTITSMRTAYDQATGHYSGKTSTNVRKEEKPGITANLAAIIQNQAIQVLLKHMGFKLPTYREDIEILEMPSCMEGTYHNLEAEAKQIIMKGGKDALSRYLQATLCYPYMPWQPIAVYSKFVPGMFACAEAMPDDMVLPHHEWLAEYYARQVKAGYRVLTYAEHTLRMDLMPDVAEKVTRIALEKYGVTLKIAVLRSTTVAPGMRAAWFTERERDGTNVVICHPRLVRTGLNLIGWPKIVVLEPCYSLFTLAQAKKRAFRPTQTKDCEVTFLAYADTMSARAISIIARKSAAAAILSGDDLDAGLMEFDSGMSLFQQLAASVKAEEEVKLDDVRALFQQSSEAVAAQYTGADADLGIDQAALDAVAQYREQGQSHDDFALPVPSVPVQQPVTYTGTSSLPLLDWLGDEAMIDLSPKEDVPQDVSTNVDDNVPIYVTEQVSLFDLLGQPMPEKKRKKAKAVPVGQLSLW